MLMSLIQKISEQISLMSAGVYKFVCDQEEVKYNTTLHFID